MEQQLNNNNYFAPDMMKKYWSVSQFKAFEKCEAAAVAEMNGIFQPKRTPALMIGSYVDAYFSDEFDEFVEANPEIFNSRTGALKSEFQNANKIINRIESQPVLLEYLTGEKQKIFTAELFGVNWKIKTDVFNPERIVDLKVVKDMNDVFEKGSGWKSFIEFWGYDLQAAIYTKIEQLYSGRSERLPFYLVVGTKEEEPNTELIWIPEYEQDAAILQHGVESKLKRFELVKQGLVPPSRCENCAYCRQTKIITRPKKFTVEGGLVADE